MGRLSRRLLLSTSLAGLAATLAPGLAAAQSCVFSDPRFICPPGAYHYVQGGYDDLSIEFTGPTQIFPENTPGILNNIGQGVGTLQKVSLGESGVSIYPVGNAFGILINAFSQTKPVAAELTGRLDILSTATGDLSSGVYVGASGNINIDISGRIDTSGALTNALEVRSLDGDISVRSSAAIRTTGAGAAGVLVDRHHQYGPIWYDQNDLMYDVRTNPQLGDPDVSNVDFAPITRGSVDVHLTAPVTVEGQSFVPDDPKQPSVAARGVVARNQWGDVNLTVGDVTVGSPTQGTPGIGILANAVNGDVNIDVTGTMNLYGANLGIYAVAEDGRVTIKAPMPVFIEMSATTYIRTEAGSFNITTGDVTMTAFNEDNGIFSTRPRVFMVSQRNNQLSTITTGAIDVSTFNADAFIADVKNADITFKSITMSGNRAKGVFLSGEEIDPGAELTARASINGPITQTGRDAWGVYFRMLDATINSNIAQSGANSLGIYADGLGYAPILLRLIGNITSSGDGSTGIYAQQTLFGSDPYAFIRVSSDGDITMTGRNATGVMIENYTTPEKSEEYYGSPDYAGSAPVAATFNGDVKATAAGGRAIEVVGGDVILNLHGVTLGGSDSDERSGAGVVARAFNNLTIANTGALSSMNLVALSAIAENGAVTVINSGQIAGAVSLEGATGASFQNSGQFWTAGLNTNPGGVLQNSGFVGVVGAPAGSMDVRIAADVINSGAISLMNGVAGDRLTIGDGATNSNARVTSAGRSYVGAADARLEVDAALTDGGVADALNLTGPVSGFTKIAVTNLARGVSTITPTFIPVVTGAGAATSDAFGLQGGSIASGLTDWRLEQRGDAFGLASQVSVQRAGDASRAGLRAINVFNLVTAPDAGVGGGGASGSAILNYAPAQPRSAPPAFARFDANASGVEPAREATVVAHLGGVHQRAKAQGDETSASALFGGLDVVWGPLTGRAPRFTAGIFGGYSSGTTDMAGSSRAVSKASTYGARVRYDAEGWFVGAAARLGGGDLKYSVAGAQGSGDTLFHALDAFLGKRFDIGSWYFQPALAATYANVDSNTFNVGGSPMRIGANESRAGGEMRIGRDNILTGAAGWSMDAWVSGGAWRSIAGGATQFAILALAPPSDGTIWSYGGGLAVKAPRDALTLRLGAYGQAGAVQSFTIYGGVSVPFGG